MGTGTKQEESVREELTKLNCKFHRKLLVTDAFYKQLMQAGFAYRQCLLISIFPDSSNTYCGKIIKQDGEVVEFDVDLDTAECSSWENVTGSFYKVYEKNKSSKPFLKEVVAYNLFQKLKFTS